MEYIIGERAHSQPGVSRVKEKRYRSFKDYLKDKYGCVVFKLPIDAGFTCPNRDGTLGTGGCIYCDGRGSRLRREGPLPTVSEQIKRGMDFYRERRGAKMFIPYFQTFTNTYAPLEDLRALYDEALSFPEAVGLSVGTRPDCLPDEVIGLLASRAVDREIWVELGVQSMHRRTLEFINRCHTPEDFTSAAERAAGAGLSVCAHIILGLPGEGPEEMMETARALARLPVKSVKIHLLLVLEGTPMADLYRRGEVTVPTLEEYVTWAADFLEVLPPEMIIQRLTADGYRDILIAPDWARNKMAVLTAINKELEDRGSRQGSRAGHNFVEKGRRF
jgi:radical SAM protein (TIGR01212 family)